MLHKILTDWARTASIRIRLTRVASLGDYEHCVARQTVGLAVWALWEKESVEELCASLAAAKAVARPPLRLCYIVPELAEHTGLLAEVGGQVVMSDLPRLQTALPKILKSCQLASHGYHPLTGGLVERLPWS